MTTNATEPSIVLLTAGIGSRLGTLTNKRNKGLISINNKAIVSHVLDALPADIPVIVALGHFGDLVRQYLEIAYPKREFRFREIAPYQGPSSSSGYSLWSLRDIVPGPFIFCTNDTIVREHITFEGRNWLGIGISDDLEKYTRVSQFGDRVTRIYRKGEPGGTVAYTGLAEIHDAGPFWDALGKSLAERGECSDVEGLFGLLDLGLYTKTVGWFDTGTKDRFEEAVRALGGQQIQLPKEDEDLYFQNGEVIKFFASAEKSGRRVERSRRLSGLVPTVNRAKTNFYCYEWVEGQMMSEVLSAEVLQRFLNWASEYLWSPVQTVGTGDVRKLNMSFYRDKTLNRVQMLFQDGWVQDGRYKVNGIWCESPLKLIGQLDNLFFNSSMPVQFHGDLHPDNIIVKPDGNFALLDWREDFADELDWGDNYYDLGKLYHGLLVSHDFVKNNQYEVKVDGEIISFDIAVHFRNLECIHLLEKWVERRGLSVKRLRIITALIYLNIAPLHHYPYNQLLYFLGLRMLQRVLEGNGELSW